MTPEEIADRFDNRAGYKLVNYGTVGLPVYRLTAVGLCLAKKSLSPIDEFILRGIAAGIESVGDIAGFLGLDMSVVESCLAELIRTECVRIANGGTTKQRQVALTGKGTDLASAQEAVVPVEQTVVFHVDGLTRKPRLYPSESLYKPRELKELGISEVRAFPSRPPELEEIDIKDVIEVVRLDFGREESPRQLLRLNTVERRDRIFLEAVALAYRAETGGGVQIAFAIDGRISVDHEQAFARAQGLEKTQLFRGLLEPARPPQMDELLGKDLSVAVDEVAKRQGDAEEIRREARVARSRVSVRVDASEPVGQSNQDGSSEAAKRLEAAESKMARLQVRPLAVYEHAVLLRRALAEADQRLLIMSPWIRRAVVDNAFIKALRQALGRGVTVYLGYGLGETDEGEAQWDKDARGDLEKLAKEFPQRFKLKRLGDTHAKVLIKDGDYFVITSFNWLSFKGNPHQTFREEWGTLVGVRSVVEDYFQKMALRFGA